MVAHLSKRRTWLRLSRLEDRAVPAQFTVLNTNDSLAGSLRQAITDANAAPGPDSINFDPSVFNSPQSISLLSALPTVTDALSITGPGSKLLTVQRDGAAATTFRVLTVNTTSGTAVSLSGAKLTGGVVTDATIVSGNGGGIFLQGANLNLIDVVITGNSTTANGGGIGVSNGTPGRITIVDSTVSNNQGAAGGGIYFGNNGGLDMQRTTVSGNSATVWGGGLYFFSNALSTWTIRNSTISGNSVVGSPGTGGGIALYNSGGDTNRFSLLNSTVTNNSSSGAGGGIYATFNGTAAVSPLVISGSIIAQNTSSGTPGSGPDIFSSGTVNVDFSLVGVADDGFAPTGANNKTGTAAVPLNAQLGALANNGGPTFTHLPQAGSLAIDNGTNSSNSGVDQRGLTRTAGAATDIGSVEVNGALPSAAIVSAPNVGPAGGGTTYQVVIRYADDTNIKVSSIDKGDITVTGPGGSLTVTGVTVDVNTDGTPRLATYTLTAPGGSFDSTDNGTYTVSLKANEVQDVSGNFIPATPLATFSVFIPIPLVFTVDEGTDIDDNITTPGSLSIREAVRLANANAFANDTITFAAALSGTTISLNSELAINDLLTVTGPAAKITLDGQSLTRIMNIGSATASFSNMNFVNGKTGDGGAVFTNNSTLTFTNTAFTNNAATGRGGAFFLFNTNTLTMTNSTLTGNTGGRGAGIYTHFTGTSTINLTSCNLTSNIATAVPTVTDAIGGAVSMFGSGDLTMTGCVVSNNASVRGGGIYAQGALNKITVVDSTFSNNDATNDLGGAISIFGSAGATLTVRGSTLSGNKGSSGGAIFANGALAVTIENSTISGNEQLDPNGRGGGIGFFGFGTVGASFTMRNSTMTNNKANGLSGGGIHMSNQTTNLPTIESSIISGNIHVANTSPDIYGPLTANGSNSLIGAAGTLGLTFTGTGNQVGTIASPIDAKLGPLANNGGPTLTHALLAGSPAIDKGNNSAGLPFDQRGTGFNRVSGKSADVGAYELQVATAPPQVSGVTFNNGAGQRSLVTSVTVSFNEAVTIGSGAFLLERYDKGSAGTIGVTVNQVGSDVTLTFNNTGSIALDPGGSLPDGKYQLTIVSDNVTGAGGKLDGNKNGTVEGSPVDNVTSKVHRLFGDADGDGSVNASDFAQFRSVFGTGPSIFDYNADNATGTADFAQFRARFGLGGYLP